MSVLSFIRIERGSGGGPGLETEQDAFFVLKSVNIKISRSVASKLALVPANRYY